MILFMLDERPLLSANHTGGRKTAGTTLFVWIQGLPSHIHMVGFSEVHYLPFMSYTQPSYSKQPRALYSR